MSVSKSLKKLVCNLYKKAFDYVGDIVPSFIKRLIKGFKTSERNDWVDLAVNCIEKITGSSLSPEVKRTFESWELFDTDNDEWDYISQNDLLPTEYEDPKYFFCGLDVTGIHEAITERLEKMPYSGYTVIKYGYGDESMSDIRPEYSYSVNCVIAYRGIEFGVIGFQPVPFTDSWVLDGSLYQNADDCQYGWFFQDIEGERGYRKNVQMCTIGMITDDFMKDCRRRVDFHFDGIAEEIDENWIE